jgi:hypothetical protein
VRLDDLQQFEYVGEVEPGIHLYTALVRSVQQVYGTVGLC